MFEQKGAGEILDIDQAISALSFRSLNLYGSESGLDCQEHALRQRVLKFEHGFHGTVEAVRPNMMTSAYPSSSAYTHTFVKNTPIRIVPGIGTSSRRRFPVSASPPFPLVAGADARVDIVSVGLTYRWDDPKVAIPAAPVVRTPAYGERALMPIRPARSAARAERDIQGDSGQGLSGGHAEQEHTSAKG